MFTLSLTVIVTICLGTLLLLVQPATAEYTVVAAHYTPENFFDGFNFFTGKDPTKGYVDYIDRTKAQNQGIIRNDGNSVYIGVDYWSYLTSGSARGRQSVRLESKKKFTRGLFVLDLQHLPGSVCGTWPAFWTLGDNWPNNGEIDIIEGVHQNVQNHMALHTKAGCSITGEDSTGTMLTPNCDVKAPGQASNQGCSIVDNRKNSYGDGFNNHPPGPGASIYGGGAYVMEWTEWAIKIWFWPRDLIPEDVLDGNPEPLNWGTPAGTFGAGDNCRIDDFFCDHRVIFDITFCGEWAGNVWGESGCGSLAAKCTDYVRSHPEAFVESYWRINSLKIWSS